VAGSLPVLKPREVAALLERLGFVETRQRGGHIANTDTRMAAARRYHFTAVAISPRHCFGRSRATSG
jgi:hypothetical protein